MKSAEEEVEELNKQKEDVSSSASDREGKVDEAKKELAEANKLLTTLTRKISNAEATRDQLKMDRKAILQYCKVPKDSFFQLKNNFQLIYIVCLFLPKSSTHDFCCCCCYVQLICSD